MSYHPQPNAPGYWQYAGLPVQADVETHQFAVQACKTHLAPRARVLDVAAGHGALTQALIHAGFDLSCTSWNDKINIPVPAYRIDLDKAFGIADVGGKSFAMVFAIEIIEHIENPAQLLRSIAGLLEPGGLLVLSTPNVESASARLEWLVRGCPYSFSGQEITRNRHISILWREGLEQFFALAGLTIVEKHLHGQARYHGWGQRLLKAPVHALMKSLLKGDLTGNSRTYLLRRNSAQPRSVRPEEVA